MKYATRSSTKQLQEGKLKEDIEKKPPKEPKRSKPQPLSEPKNEQERKEKKMPNEIKEKSLQRKDVQKENHKEVIKTSKSYGGQQKKQEQGGKIRVEGLLESIKPNELNASDFKLHSSLGLKRFAFESSQKPQNPVLKSQGHLSKYKAESPAPAIAEPPKRRITENTILQIFEGQLSYGLEMNTFDVRLYTCNDIETVQSIPKILQNDEKHLVLEEKMCLTDFQRYMSRCLDKASSEDHKIITGWLEPKDPAKEMEYQEITDSLLRLDQVGVCSYNQSCKIFFLHKYQISGKCKDSLSFQVKQVQSLRDQSLYFILYHQPKKSAPNLVHIYPQILYPKMVSEPRVVKAEQLKDRLTPLMVIDEDGEDCLEIEEKAFETSQKRGFCEEEGNDVAILQANPYKLLKKDNSNISEEELKEGSEGFGANNSEEFDPDMPSPGLVRSVHGSVAVDEEIIPVGGMQEEQGDKMTELNEHEDSLCNSKNGGFEGDEQLIENKSSRSGGEEKNIVGKDTVQYSVM